MYNVDRWAAYTKQFQHRTGNYVKDIMRYEGPWCVLTPRQMRRVVKKGRKRNDQSIGLFS
jgi:hypothetical protein